MAQINLRLGAKPSRTSTKASGIGPRLRRRLSSVVAQLRADPALFVRTLLPEVAVFRVYAIETAIAPDRIAIPEIVFTSLSEHELKSSTIGDPEFCDRQRRRLERFGQGCAFAARQGDQVAHVSWLLPSEVLAKEEITVLRLKADEAEITACETKEQYRGKGIYRFVIRELLAHAAKLGIKRVFMKTTWRNTASQKGIKGAGLTPAGVAVVANVPGRNIKPVVLTLMP